MAKNSTKKAAGTPAAPSRSEIIEVPNKLQVKVGANQGADQAALDLAKD
ncbi:MAG: hypothetical protein HOC72_19745 [Rhodospirillaceae bacterium]|nr:hypothetical protein [Rhodospirillaceae bacterium]